MYIKNSISGIGTQIFGVGLVGMVYVTGDGIMPIVWEEAAL